MLRKCPPEKTGAEPYELDPCLTRRKGVHQTWQSRPSHYTRIQGCASNVAITAEPLYTYTKVCIKRGNHGRAIIHVYKGVHQTWQSRPSHYTRIQRCASNVAITAEPLYTYTKVCIKRGNHGRAVIHVYKGVHQTWQSRPSHYTRIQRCASNVAITAEPLYTYTKVCIKRGNHGRAIIHVYKGVHQTWQSRPSHYTRIQRCASNVAITAEPLYTNTKVCIKRGNHGRAIIHVYKGVHQTRQSRPSHYTHIQRCASNVAITAEPLYTYTKVCIKRGNHGRAIIHVYKGVHQTWQSRPSHYTRIQRCASNVAITAEPLYTYTKVCIKRGNHGRAIIHVYKGVHQTWQSRPSHYTRIQRCASNVTITAEPLYTYTKVCIKRDNHGRAIIHVYKGVHQTWQSRPSHYTRTQRCASNVAITAEPLYTYTKVYIKRGNHGRAIIHVYKGVHQTRQSRPSHYTRIQRCASNVAITAEPLYTYTKVCIKRGNHGRAIIHVYKGVHQTWQSRPSHYTRIQRCASNEAITAEPLYTYTKVCIKRGNHGRAIIHV